MEKSDLVAKAMFMEKMGHLLDAGIPLMKALQILKAEIDNALTKAAIDNLLKGIESQDEKFNVGDWLDKDYFKESERLMIEMGMKARRPDRSFLTIAQWVEKELLAL
jgi:type II secretory pathway component PulF